MYLQKSYPTSVKFAICFSLFVWLLVLTFHIVTMDTVPHFMLLFVIKKEFPKFTYFDKIRNTN